MHLLLQTQAVQQLRIAQQPAQKDVVWPLRPTKLEVNHRHPLKLGCLLPVIGDAKFSLRHAAILERLLHRLECCGNVAVANLMHVALQHAVRLGGSKTVHEQHVPPQRVPDHTRALRLPQLFAQALVSYEPARLLPNFSASRVLDAQVRHLALAAEHIPDDARRGSIVCDGRNVRFELSSSPVPVVTDIGVRDDVLSVKQHAQALVRSVEVVDHDSCGAVAVPFRRTQLGQRVSKPCRRTVARVLAFLVRAQHSGQLRLERRP
mmetsp:Transcript_7431/g.16855  ORF Transcript_7431/g.16855 Transcript_7431/m.16855 type:complete len:263 (+) Transcript_7431:1062-1850(+)